MAFYTDIAKPARDRALKQIQARSSRWSMSEEEEDAVSSTLPLAPTVAPPTSFEAPEETPEPSYAPTPASQPMSQAEMIEASRTYQEPAPGSIAERYGLEQRDTLPLATGQDVFSQAGRKVASAAASAAEKIGRIEVGQAQLAGIGASASPEMYLPGVDTQREQTQEAIESTTMAKMASGELSASEGWAQLGVDLSELTWWQQILMGFGPTAAIPLPVPIKGMGGVRQFNKYTSDATDLLSSSVWSDAPAATKAKIKTGIQEQVGGQLAERVRQVAPDLAPNRVNEIVDILIDDFMKPGMKPEQFQKHADQVINRVRGYDRPTTTRPTVSPDDARMPALEPEPTTPTALPEAAAPSPAAVSIEAVQAPTVGRTVESGEQIIGRSVTESTEQFPGELSSTSTSTTHSWRAMGDFEYNKMAQGEKFGRQWQGFSFDAQGNRIPGEIDENAIAYWADSPGTAIPAPTERRGTMYLVEVEIPPRMWQDEPHPITGERVTRNLVPTIEREGTVADIRAVWKDEGQGWVPHELPVGAKAPTAAPSPAAALDELPGFTQDNPLVNAQQRGDPGAIKGAEDWIAKNQNTRTGGFKNIALPTDDVAQLPGLMGEEAWLDDFRHSQRIKELADDMRERGWVGEPIDVEVDVNSVVSIFEGNHRVRAAQLAGLEQIPVNVRYLGGSEISPGPWSPNDLVQKSAPSPAAAAPEELAYRSDLITADKVVDAEVGDVIQPNAGGKQYELASKNPDQWDAVALGETPETGAEAFKDRLRLEVSKGLDPDLAMDAIEFIDSLPPNLLAEIRTSFRDVAEEATTIRTGEFSASAVAGRYYPASSLITLIKSVLNQSADPSRIVIHEIFHHIEQFIPEEELSLLRSQWRKDMADNGARVLKTAEDLRSQANSRPLTDSERSKINKAYRYGSGVLEGDDFNEWFAETMSDKALRDIYANLPEYRNLLQRAFEAVSDIAVAVMNFLLRKGRIDQAERIYQRILKNEFPERLRYQKVGGGRDPLRFEESPVGRAADEPPPSGPEVPPVDQPPMGDIPGNLPPRHDFPIKPLDDYIAYLQRADTGFETNIRKIPVLRQMYGAIDPAAIHQAEPVAQLGIARQMFVEDHYSKAKVVSMEWMAEAKRELGFDSKGRANLVKAIPGVPEGPLFKTIFDLIEHPERYVLTESQNETLQRAKNIMASMLKAEQDAGVEVTEVANYWYRNVIGSGNDTLIERLLGNVSRSSRPKGHIKPRFYEFAEETVAAGKKLDVNPLTSLTDRLEAGISAIADKRILAKIAQLEGMETGLSRADPAIIKAAADATARKKTAENAILAIQRAKRGEQLPTGTIKAIERVFPDVEGRLGPASRITLEDLVRAGTEAAEEPIVLPVPNPGTIRKLQKLLDEARVEALANPDNSAIQKKAKDLASKLGFTKYRFSLGEEFIIEKHPIKTLRGIQMQALDDLLVEIRGVPTVVKTSSGKPKTIYKDGLIDKIRKEEKLAQKAKSRAMDAAKEPRMGEEVILNKIAPASLVEEINQWIDLPGQFGQAAVGGGKGFNINTVSRYANEFLQLWRSTMVSFDLSYGYIQGQPVLFRNPVAWWKAQSAATVSLVNQPFQYVDKNFDVIMRGIDSGAIQPPTEMLFGKRGLSALPTKIPVLGVGFTRTNRAFEWFTFVAQTELYKAAEAGVIKRRGVGGELLDADGNVITDVAYKSVEDELISLSSAIRKTVGTESYARLGVSRRQQKVEALLAFAPRFYRAFVGLMTQALTRGPGGGAAQKVMGSMIAGATALTIGVNLATQQKMPNYTNVEDANWGKAKVGDSWVTFYGPFHPYFRSGARFSVYMAQGKPKKAVEEVYRTFTSKGSLLARNVNIWGEVLYTGKSKTFEGETIDFSDDGVINWLKEQAPISPSQVTTGLIAGRPEEIINVIGINVVQSFHMDLKEARNEELERLRAEGKTPEIEPGPYDKQDVRVTRKVNEAPSVIKANQIYIERAGKFESELSLYIKKKDDINVEYDDKISKAAEKYGAGEDFRIGLSQLNNDRGVRLSDLDKENVKLLEELEKNNQDKPLFNRILAAYMKVVSNPDLDDEFTGFDFEKMEARIAELEETDDFKEFGPESIAAIQEYLRGNYHTLVQELHRDRELLRPYWEIPDNYIASPRVSPYHKKRLQAYYDRGEISLPGEWADIQPHIDAINGIRKAYEYANRDVSDRLGKWEYATPVHMDLRFKHASSRRESNRVPDLTGQTNVQPSLVPDLTGGR